MIEEIDEFHKDELLHEDSSVPHSKMIQHGDNNGEVLQEHELLRLEEKCSQEVAVCSYEEKTCEDSSQYVGEFKWGVKHGPGYYHFKNGDTYVGGYFADKMHGNWYVLSNSSNLLIHAREKKFQFIIPDAEKRFAFVEIHTAEEANNAMALDVIVYEGVPVHEKRPSDYNPFIAAALGPSQPSSNLNLATVGLVAGSSSVADGSDCIFVGGLPYYLTEEQIIDILSSFGPLGALISLRIMKRETQKIIIICSDNIRLSATIWQWLLIKGIHYCLKQ
ncbi:hypothetical protein SUGI_0098430 [Cryptomeria japonica]|nr:hypothetical protein SUGI_0098430 [Cryptomeria japonica]